MSANLKSICRIRNANVHILAINVSLLATLFAMSKCFKIFIQSTVMPLILMLLSLALHANASR